MARAFVFPGQGSQSVGMGKPLCDAFPAAREVYEEVDDALSHHLSRIIFDGPEADLTLTENAQPALMATSMAIVRVLESEVGLVISDASKFVAGHSLGEYSALTAAGSLKLSDAARLLRRRGQAMQNAVPLGSGAMAVVLGLDLGDVAAIAKEAAQDDVCEIGNDNAPSQIVLSGNAAAIERATAIAEEKGARRVLPLSVSAPFHCSLLAPAADDMAEALEEIIITAPRPRLISNVTAQAVDEPARIRILLVQQVTATVRWREGVEFMKSQDVDTLVELGAGTVLSGLARRVDREIRGISVQTPNDIESFSKTL